MVTATMPADANSSSVGETQEDARHQRQPLNLPLLSAPPNLDDGLETPGPFAHPRRPNDSTQHT